ncbi:DUF4145 domain-containing protein [Azospirillum palustre]
MAGFKVVKSYCNRCSNETNHRVLHKESTEWSDDYEGSEICGGDIYTLLSCNGCDNVKLFRENWFSEITDDDGKPLINETSYPPETDRRVPEWFSNISEDFDFDEHSEMNSIKSLLSEIYVACQNDQRRLAVMGVRALLEHIMIGKVGDQGTFAGNLSKFLDDRYISRPQKDVLDTVLEAGHATMHRFYNPSKRDLKTVVDIVENLIQTIVIHGRRAAELAKRIPPKVTAKRIPKFEKTEPPAVMEDKNADAI